MQITMFGASGKVGQVVVAEALRRGHSVRVFVHHSNPFAPNEHITTVRGSFDNPATVKNVLHGSDAVISTLGSWGTKQQNTLATGMAAIIPAMKAEGIARIITVTGSGALLPGESCSLLERANRALIALTAPRILADGDTHLKLLSGSDLQWSTVRAPAMHNRHSANYKLTGHRQLPAYFISRRAVAASMLDLAESTDWAGEAPFISRA